MEKLLPLVIGLAIFGFKSYQNYKKQQDAALKRKQPIPVSPPPFHAPKSPSVPKTVPVSSHQNPYYSEEIKETNEIQRFKNERETRNELNKRAKAKQEAEETKSSVRHIDLREAVIMSTILDRPYK